MEKKLEDALVGAGVDIRTGIERTAGNEALYLKLLNKFLQDQNYERFLSAAAQDDLQTARIHIHALKGLSANLSLMELYQECVIVNAAVREGTLPELAGLQRQYGRVIDAIRQSV